MRVETYPINFTKTKLLQYHELEEFLQSVGKQGFRLMNYNGMALVVLEGWKTTIGYRFMEEEKVSDTVLGFGFQIHESKFYKEGNIVYLLLMIGSQGQEFLDINLDLRVRDKTETEIEKKINLKIGPNIISLGGKIQANKIASMDLGIKLLEFNYNDGNVVPRDGFIQYMN